MNKPIKRHQDLVLLSRDHHDGLLLVWKLKQGIAFGTHVQTMANFILYAYNTDLAPHFADEENLLFNKAPLGDSLTTTALDQHASLRLLVQRLGNEPTLELVQQFMNELEAHIRFEERVLFPHFEQMLDAEALKIIGLKLDESHKNLKKDKWTNEFWIKPAHN